MQNIFSQGNAFGSASFRPVRLGQQATTQEIVGDGALKVKPDQTYRPLPTDKVKPIELGPRPAPRAPKDRFNWSVKRICRIMTKVQEKEQEVDPETKGHLFWSYAKHSKNEAAFLKSYAELCPGLPVPEKPAKPEKVLEAESPDKVGFHGKTQISYTEAKELMLALDEVLRPFTPEESASDLASQACLRDFTAGNFPIVEELQDDLSEFVAAGDTGATFEISKGQVIVAGKAIDCAVALGRGKAIKTALTVGGIGAGAGLLWLLLL